jgi:hypothetical protein
LLSFVESSPRAYRLKASKRRYAFFNIRRDIGLSDPLWHLDWRHNEFYFAGAWGREL